MWGELIAYKWVFKHRGAKTDGKKKGWFGPFFCEIMASENKKAVGYMDKWIVIQGKRDKKRRELCHLKQILRTSTVNSPYDCCHCPCAVSGSW